MRPKHGGWATQAKRRGEEYVGCTVCGAPRHPRHHRVELEEPTSAWEILGLVLFVLFMYATIIYALPLVLEAMLT